MSKTRFWWIALCFLAWCGAAQAQLVTSLKLSKNQFVAGEPVIATVTVTNHSGQDLVFQDIDRVPWLDFIVKNNHGAPATPRGTAGFGAMKIGIGQSMARQIDLAQVFHLTDPGNFSVSALVRIPGQNEGFSTNRVLFNLNPGRQLVQPIKVGLTGKPGQTREFRLLNFSGDQKSQLYVQIIDGRTGLQVRTFPLGDTLSIRKPMVTVDRQQRFHVMFLATPTMWVHAQVDTDGNIVKRDIHQRGPQGEPQLMAFADGSVGVSNSIPYDPEAAAKRQAESRKASDRPAVTYD